MQVTLQLRRILMELLDKALAMREVSAEIAEGVRVRESLDLVRVSDVGSRGLALVPAMGFLAIHQGSFVVYMD
jgi:hypothetical protein